MKYDPYRHFDPESWLATDETERLDAVVEFHNRKKIRLPNVRVHATIHTIVENQIAEGEKYPTASVLQRLMSEGLDRHDAVHAIGSVLAKYLYTVLRDKTGGPETNAEYFEEIKRLTAESWRNTRAE